MDIYHLDDTSFKLSGKDTTVLTFPRVKNKADIVIGSAELVTDVKKAVLGPGEYEIRGVSVFGYQFGYLIEMDNVRVLLISDISKAPSDDDIEHVGKVDVLLIPAGEQTETFVQKFSPSVIAPFGENTQSYVEKAGVVAEPLPKLSVKPGTFLPDESKIVVLT